MIYIGSVDCKFVRKRGRVKPGMRNACLRSLQNLAGVLPSRLRLSRVAPRTILRPFPLRQRRLDVFVNRGTGIDAATRISSEYAAW